jgi:hypothetical protein
VAGTGVADAGTDDAVGVAEAGNGEALGTDVFVAGTGVVVAVLVLTGVGVEA